MFFAKRGSVCVCDGESVRERGCLRVRDRGRVPSEALDSECHESAPSPGRDGGKVLLVCDPGALHGIG